MLADVFTSICHSYYCVQVKALSGSLLLTGLAAAGGFYVLESLGVVNSDAPTSTSAFQRAWTMVGRPLPDAEDSQRQQQQLTRHRSHGPS